MNGELVHLEVARGVATITLDSPHNRNALSRQLVADLERHLASALGDDRARVVVLTGNGPSFCSGADLKERRAAHAEPPAPRSRGLAPILQTMWNAPKPIVGRINGPARAGGIGLVAACDIAVAVETATFAFSEVRIGVIPAMIAVVVIPKIGEPRALELFMTGDTFDAGSAVSYGLLTAAAPDGELDAAVGRYVESLLKGAPGALAECKRLVRDVPGRPMEAAFAEMTERSARFFASEEGREGLAAFAEKRPPRWVTGAGAPPPVTTTRSQGADMATIPRVLHEPINTAFPANVCLVGTVLPNGFAQVTPRGSTMVFDDQTLALWERGKGSTNANLRNGTKVTVFLRKPQLRESGVLPKGGIARFYGIAEIHRSGPAYEEVWTRLVQPEKDRDPDKKGFAVLIRVERAEDLDGQPLALD